MFNMYDDAGIKTQIINPYQVKKLEPIANVKNKVTQKKEQDEKPNSQYNNTFSNEAKSAYKQIANIHIEENIFHAYQLMHSEFVTIKDTDHIHKCWELMEKHDLKQIPVIGLNGKIKGLATMKNLVKALIENLNNPEYVYQTLVDSITKYDIMTAEPIADIRRVAKVMVQYHLNSIPIVSSEDDEVVGIISRADILQAVSSNPHFQLWA